MDENNNPGSTPEISTEPRSVSDQISLNLAKSLTGWATFRAVIDIILGGFTCLGGIFLLFMSLIFFASGSNIENSFYNYSNLNGMTSEQAFLFGIIFLVSGILYPIIGVFVILAGAKLIRTVDHLKMAISVNDDGRILDFMQYLSKFFKFNGIASIIRISLTIAAIIFFIVLTVLSISNHPNLGSDFSWIP